MLPWLDTCASHVSCTLLPSSLKDSHIRELVHSLKETATYDFHIHAAMLSSLPWRTPLWSSIWYLYIYIFIYLCQNSHPTLAGIQQPATVEDKKVPCVPSVQQQSCERSATLYKAVTGTQSHSLPLSSTLWAGTRPPLKHPFAWWTLLLFYVTSKAGKWESKFEQFIPFKM